ncbi:hypothetical protein DFJ73DRAFT_568600 [Zopfochytrium polystomum]|nr:hypothetical protein DFJ73DRAFT_568600 [Zopfochytrium polystomum]
MEPEISTPAATAPQQQHDAPPVAKFMRKRSSKTAAPFSFAASGTAESLRQDFATRTLDVDGHERKEKVLAGDDAEGLYKGLGGYNEYVNKRVEKTTQSNAGGLRAGPLKAATNVRISSRFDYQPHVCKDYKETGSCGYGDSCIYMHDRGDYKMGWQLDLEWEEEQKRKQKEEEMRRFNQGQEAEEDEIEEDDDLPMSCMVCGNDFKDPVATKCQHYFCENCAIRTHTKTGKCFACSAPTNGVFNAAKDFKAKLLAKKKKMEERAEEVRRKAAAAGVEDEQ